MIEKSLVLPLSQSEAFILFTSRISEWWPPTHRPSKDPLSQLFLEPGGRFWERARDGREAELGRVVRWDAPVSLEFDFYLGTSAAQPTSVTITFTPEEGGTRVQVRHRPKPESQDLWESRASIYDRSWNAVLSALQNA